MAQRIQHIVPENSITDIPIPERHIDDPRAGINRITNTRTYCLHSGFVILSSAGKRHIKLSQIAL